MSTQTFSIREMTIPLNAIKVNLNGDTEPARARELVMNGSTDVVLCGKGHQIKLFQLTMPSQNHLNAKAWKWILKQPGALQAYQDRLLQMLELQDVNAEQLAPAFQAITEGKRDAGLAKRISQLSARKRPAVAALKVLVLNPAKFGICSCCGSAIGPGRMLDPVHLHCVHCK